MTFDQTVQLFFIDNIHRYPTVVSDLKSTPLSRDNESAMRLVLNVYKKLLQTSTLTHVTKLFFV